MVADSAAESRVGKKGQRPFCVFGMRCTSRTVIRFAGKAIHTGILQQSFKGRNRSLPGSTMIFPVAAVHACFRRTRSFLFSRSRVSALMHVMSKTTAAKGISARLQNPWLFNAPADLLIGCGGWSLPLVALTFVFTRNDATFLASAFYFLTVFCNNPHYMATLYRAYGTGRDFSQYRFFTIYITILLFLTAALVHLLPALFPWVITLFLVWSPWHYSGQNFGIAMLLVRRTGTQPRHEDRQLLFASYVASYLVWLLALQSIETPDPGLILFRLPRLVTNTLLPLFTVTFLLLAGAALVRMARASNARAILGPAMLSLSQGLWFIGPPLLQYCQLVKLPAAYYSAGVLAFIHCAQYLWITTYFARRESGVSIAEGPRRFHFARYYITLIVGGLALFIPGPWLVSRWLGHEFVESFLIFAALVNLHHFILDGAIWKLRDSRIARLLLGRGAPENGRISNEGLPQLLRWLVGKSFAARVLRYSFIAGVIVLGIVDQTQFNLARKEAGMEQLARAESMNPRDARVYFHRAQLLLGSSDTNAALAELRRAVTINPRNVAVQQLLAEVLFKSGDAPAALAQYGRIAEFFRPDLATAMNRGLLARQLSSNDLAARSFEQALRLAPERTELHYLLADSLAATGKTNSAMDEYTLYIRLHESGAGSEAQLPLLLAAGTRLGELYAAQGRWVDAIKCWQRAADVATAFNRMNDAARLLNKVAEAQEHQGRVADAASTRRAAEAAAKLARVRR